MIKRYYQSFNKAYHKLLCEFVPIGNCDYEIKDNFSQSQGAATQQLRMCYDLSVDLHTDPLPLQDFVYMNPALAAAETGWLFDGCSDVPGFLPERVRKLFEKMARLGSHPDAYGYRLRKIHEIDQIREVIKMLRFDHSTRKAVMIVWNPKTDLTGGHTQPHRRYAPCPTQLGFKITKTPNGTFLDSWMVLRSSDVIFGVPYDVLRHALMTHAICRTLRLDYPSLKPGKMVFNLHNCHIYEDHRKWLIKPENLAEFEESYDKARMDDEIVYNECNFRETERAHFQEWTVESIETNAAAYGKEFNVMAERYRDYVVKTESETFKVVT